MHSFQLWTTLALLFRLSFFFIVLEVSQTSHASTDTSQVSPSATKISQTTSVYGDSMVMTSDGTINLLKSTPEPAPWSSTSLFTLSFLLSTPSTEAQSRLTSSSSSSSSLLTSLTSSMSSTSSTSSSSAAAANSSSTSSSSTSSLLSSSLSTSISSSSTSSSAEAAAAASSSSTSSSSTSFLLSLSTTPSIEAQSWLTSSSSSSSSLTSSMSSTSSTSSSSAAAAANSSSTSSSSTSFLLSLSTPTPTPSSSTSSSSTLPLPTSFKPPLGPVTTVSPSSQKSSPALPTKSTAATSSASSTSLSSSQSFQTSSSSPQSTSSFSSPLRLSSSVQAPSLSPSKSSSSSTTLTSPSASSSSSSSFSRHLESSTQTLPSTQPSTEKPSDQEFAGTAVLKFDWFEELSNTSSNGYKNFSRELTAHLTDILRNSAYGSDFVRVEVYNFRNGSVIFDFKIYLKSTTVATEDFLIRVMKKGVAGSKFIITQVDVSQTFSRTSPTGKPSEETQSGLETWLIVLIACGAVIILLLLTLLFLGTQNRRLRKELSSPSRKQSTSILHQEDSLFIQAQVFSHEMYKISPTPSDSCHNDSHGFKTFSPENGDDKGAVNESYVADGGKGSDHEDEKESAPENTFF